MIKFVIEIDTYIIQNYLDYLFFDKKNSARTYNNHLKFLNTFFLWCKAKSFINTNPTESIKLNYKRSVRYWPWTLRLR